VEWLKAVRGAIVAVDTAPIIYLIEKHPDYLPLVLPFFEAVERGEVQAITSALTLTEVLVHPWRRGDQRLVQQYSRILLHARNLTTVSVSSEIAVEAARIRSDTGVKVPDAIHLANALLGGAKFFLTNDGDLVQIPGLQLLILNRLAATP
jgi:predicted nucleic acid-binding protein